MKWKDFNEFEQLVIQTILIIGVIIIHSLIYGYLAWEDIIGSDNFGGGAKSQPF